MDPHANQMVTCPYNMAHQVEHYRIQVHLAKCRKQYPNLRIVTCPFDATHYIQEEELNHHVTTCPKRGMLDAQLYVTDDDHRPVVQVLQSAVDFSCSENWDDDNAQTYKPLEAKKDALIYSKIQGATKSERSKHRYKSSVRYAQAQAENKRSEDAANALIAEKARANRPESVASTTQPKTACINRPETASDSQAESAASDSQSESGASASQSESGASASQSEGVAGAQWPLSGNSTDWPECGANNNQYKLVSRKNKSKRH